MNQHQLNLKAYGHQQATLSSMFLGNMIANKDLLFKGKDKYTQKSEITIDIHVKQHRKLGLWCAIIQLLMSFIIIGIFISKKNLTLLFGATLNALLGITGLIGVLRLGTYILITHGLLTILLVVSIVCYCGIDKARLSEIYLGSNYHLFFLVSLIVISSFIAIFSFKLASTIESTVKRLKEERMSREEEDEKLEPLMNSLSEDDEIDEKKYSYSQSLPARKKLDLGNEQKQVVILHQEKNYRRHDQPIDLKNCIQCLSGKREFKFKPCGHKALCIKCAKAFNDRVSRLKLCPKCMTPIEKLQRKVQEPSPQAL
ncbi:hypothetical protein FGO68_gene8334 [Halteria grandinella]|uniref:RING-type domain-containing protein n=1 Tax=Halteria grandinella TaxID=5974 RepID=A0A8J8SWB2_HALGN|nr:hypothetical protein FGO68_gene8334 [Halteria grandinella]